MRNLDEELDNEEGNEYPPTWYLAEGSKIVGKIKRYDKAYTIYGEAWICQIEDDEKGLLSVWLTHAVLIDRFKKLKPKLGERIAIKCFGKHSEKKYWRFKVIMDRLEPEIPDFENMQVLDKEPESVKDPENDFDDELPF